MVIRLVFCLLALQAIPVDQPFGLKGDVLGESLEQFRANNAHVLEYNPSGLKFDNRTRHFPICTGDTPAAGEKAIPLSGMDNIDIDVPAREAKQGVVYCVAGSWTMNVLNGQFGTVNIPTIGGIPAKTIRYQFLKGSLYKIDVLFNKQGTQDLLNGLQAKYGQPTVSDLAHFENKFGAKFDTSHFVWKNKLSEIEFTQAPDGSLDHLTITSYELEKNLEQLLSVPNGVKDF
jgi:hypothetical protein